MMAEAAMVVPVREEAERAVAMAVLATVAAVMMVAMLVAVIVVVAAAVVMAEAAVAVATVTPERALAKAEVSMVTLVRFTSSVQYLTFLAFLCTLRHVRVSCSLECTSNTWLKLSADVAAWEGRACGV